MPRGYPSNPEIEQAFIDLIFTSGDEHEMYLSDIYEPLADHFNLTMQQRTATSIEVTRRGEDRSYWQNLVRTAKARLIDKGVLHAKMRNGLCKLQNTKVVSVGARRRLQPPIASNPKPISEAPSKEEVEQVYESVDETPIASDINDTEPTSRTITTTYRILRDTAIARGIKLAYDYRCQICGDRIQVDEVKYYAEVHHIKPLGKPHNGPDIRENVLCVCPNHHVQLDYGAIEIDLASIFTVDAHRVSHEFINYHNTMIYNKRK